MFVIVAVFVAGLMVGRTPEYLGKKIEAFEMKMASLVHPDSAAGRAGRHGDRRRRAGTGVHGARYGRSRRSNLNNPGAHGFSEVLYAFSSAGNNNGSAFAGLTANEPFYNTALGLAMLVVPLLADHPDAGHRRLAGPQEVHAARAPARCRRTRRCSWCCWSARCCWSVR